MTQTTSEPTYIYVQAPKRRRKMPAWLWVLVAMAVVAGAGVGTFASFTASTTNSSSFATGSLILSNKVNTGTACLSSNGGGGVDTNTNSGCDAAFSLSTKKPGDSGTATLDVKDEGSIDGAHLKVYASSACTAANATGETYHGTGNPCGSVAFYIQEWSNSNHTGALTCLYGGGTASTCAFDNTKTLATFSATYSNFGNGIDLSGLTSGTTRYFTVGVQLDSAAGNNMQGRSAVMPLDWYLQQ